MASHRFSYASDLGWAYGEAPSELAGSVSTYESGAGIDIFRYPGELAAGFSDTEIGGATVTDNIQDLVIASIWNGTAMSRAAFGYGSGGRFYQIVDETTPTVSLIATVTNNRVGLEVFKDYIWYAQSTQIGRYGPINAASPTSTDAYWTGFTSTFKGQNLTHPLHEWRGKIYAGDANLLKYHDGTASATQMTLDADYVITAINDN